jgi:small subunit ribosomal protein S17
MAKKTENAAITPDTFKTAGTTPEAAGAETGAEASRRNEKVGEVVSTKMQKTIVVAVEMRKAHPKYKRVIRSTKKFYAHDEQNTAHVGDVVRIRETRPLSKLKRWQLESIIRKSSLAQVSDTAPAAEVAAQ